ncbi:RNA-guided endonuclease InsQ/TnpB family protein [Streptomyces sp. NPDC057623]|uniref:RNA-guided endonuclease InsQ/TnpB family protein n=1 Tax=Streptomyces sp. NPDC057623 TaxID=3346187 RepID=UPI00367FCFB1
MKRADGVTYRTAVVPVRLRSKDYRKVHETAYRAGLLFTNLAGFRQEFYDREGCDPSRAEALGQVEDPELLRMHAHSKQAVYEALTEAVSTALTNIGEGVEGVRMPHRAKNYRPVAFTRGYGWRITPDGKLALSLGRRDGRILLPVPEVTDARTGNTVPADDWGEVEPCWDRDNRTWSLHIPYATHQPPVLGLQNVMAVDEGIINPMTCAVETTEAYEVTVINGRSARAVKHRRNTAVAALRRKQSKCLKGSRQWRRYDKAVKRAQGKAKTSLRNHNHQVSRKVADLAQEHDTGTITVGDVRGIEKNTRNTKVRRSGRHQRRRLSQWDRGDQERHVAQKTGVGLVHIDESYSTKTCPACLTRNRPSGRNYRCRTCGFTCHRDAVGAINILMRAKHGEYRAIDPDKTIRVTYLRATPLHRAPARSTG